MSVANTISEGAAPGDTPPEDAVAGFEPLARLAIGDGDPGWILPLARLLEAASRGVGHLDVASCCADADPVTRPDHLVAIDGARALLPRQQEAWDRIRRGVERLLARRDGRHEDAAVRRELDRILPPHRKTNADGSILVDNGHQRLAAACLVDAPVGVLTGGPGTGKTTSAAALIGLNARLEPELEAADILVCAPTGKAANRLRLALHGAAQRLELESRERDLLTALRPTTLHRGLGWTPVPPEDGGPWRHNARRPLDARLVLLDESSMADVELMAALLDAVGPDTAVILLGDRDQLDSVEAGGVLAELVHRGAAAEPDGDWRNRMEARMGRNAVADWRSGLPTGAGATTDDDLAPLPGLAIGLTWSYRARNAPWILELASLVRPGASGSAAQVRALCAQHPDEALRWYATAKDLAQDCRDAWLALARRTAPWRLDEPPTQAALQAALDDFQCIVATNRQVAQANRAGRRCLVESAGVDDPGQDVILHGTPIIIEANDRSLDLANGDVGLAIGSGPGTPAQIVLIPGAEAGIPLARLPGHRPAFAITIHKSQGSEWRAIAIDLPAHAGELLDRRLLYTAVTRSSGRVGIHAPGDALASILTLGVSTG
jgi:exodeoxyribonuclease V alpha subunit